MESDILLPLSFSLGAGRWPLARRYEENVTQHYPSLCPRRRWSFIFCAIRRGENNSSPAWLMSGTWAGAAQGGSKGRIGIPFIVCVLLLSRWGSLPQDVTDDPVPLAAWPPPSPIQTLKDSDRKMKGRTRVKNQQRHHEYLICAFIQWITKTLASSLSSTSVTSDPFSIRLEQEAATANVTMKQNAGW